MPEDISLLDRVVIATPCTASWSAMKGDEKVRFCEQCLLNVYNFSAMTREEAERLIIEKEGRLCATFYQRRDGTILTRDCPIGLRALRRGLARVIATFGTAAALMLCTGMTWAGRHGSAARMRTLQPFSRICNWLAPPAAMGTRVPGKIRVLRGAASIGPQRKREVMPDPKACL